MSMNELETLWARAAKVELPQSVHDAVMAEATALDAPQQTGRTVSRRSFVRVGAAAAAVGVGAFFGLSIFGKEDTLPVFGDDENERGFVLTAYAEGVEQSDGTVLANFGGSGFFGPSTRENMYDACYLFGLGCTIDRAGAKTITYKLEGPYSDYCPENYEEYDFGSAFVCFYGSNTLRVGKTYSTPYGDQFIGQLWATQITVPVDDKSLTEQHIRAHFPMSTRLQAVNDRYQEASAADKQRATETGDYYSYIDPELEKEWDFESRLAFNEYLAATTLHISVDFDDGKLLEKRYSITPVDDFEEVYRAYLDTLDEIGHEELGGEMILEVMQGWECTYRNQPPLYTVRELEG